MKRSHYNERNAQYSGRRTARYSKPDYILAGISVALLLLGVLILASVSTTFSQEKFGNPYYFLSHQFLFGIIPGLILALIAFFIRLELIKKWAPFLLLINMGLLALVFFPKIGIDAGGASRWLALGKISFQPSEFLKLIFILYLAAWLGSRTPSKKLKEVPKEKKFSQTFMAFLIVLGTVSGFLIFQPDISTLGIILAVAGLMYFSAATPLWHTILIILMGTGGVLYLIKLASYRMKRWITFLNPEVDPLGMGYQIKQALIAVGSGGILGVGLGMSRQKFGFLPKPMSDSIFAIFSEETGFIGSIILILLFLIFLWRGFKISKNAQDKFSQLAAFGISCWIALQSFVNISSMIGILPLAGIPLPFLSYGGSALVVELAAVGLLLNISKNINKAR